MSKISIPFPLQEKRYMSQNLKEIHVSESNENWM